MDVTDHVDFCVAPVAVRVPRARGHDDRIARSRALPVRPGQEGRAALEHLEALLALNMFWIGLDRLRSGEIWSA
jgi:hypothetical protein